MSYVSLVVLRGWGLCSKYRKQQRRAGHCKGRGKQNEKHHAVRDVLVRSYLHGKKALSIARYVRNREREVDARVVLSGSYYEVGDYHELSVECGKRALSIAKEVENRQRKADASLF